MKYSFITIEREYGSGGTKIGRRLSEVSKVPCYGIEILEMVSQKYNISVERIGRYEETATNSLMYSLYMMSQVQNGNVNMLSNEGRIFLEEQKTIQRLADAGEAIFLGHCASEVLKDRDDVLNVFIHAELPDKKKRIVAEYGIPEGDVESTMKKFDKKRANYYFANTGKKWDDLRRYDVVLDSSRLGIEGCVEFLEGALK